MKVEFNEISFQEIQFLVEDREVNMNRALMVQRSPYIKDLLTKLDLSKVFHSL